jgi:RimJ/RimL family protein N-acetyltransferase
MRHNILIEGQGFRLRPIADADAPLLLALRSDPDLNRYLHDASDAGQPTGMAGSLL